MKKLSYLLIAFVGITFYSCSEEESDVLTGNKDVGGLIEKVTPGITYPQGAAATTVLDTASFSVYQGGREKIAKIEVFKQFFGETSGLKSNNALLTTINLDSSVEYLTEKFTFTYNDLIAGLVYNGAPMPASDASLMIQDYWKLTYLATLTDGTTKHLNASSTTVKVSCGSFLPLNYDNGDVPTDVATLVNLGGGIYTCSGLPFIGFSGGTVPVPFEFSDVCDTITINQILLGSNLLLGEGFITRDASGAIESFTITYTLYNGGDVASGALFDYSTQPSTYTVTP